jgi:hypothetical protein
MFSVLHSLTQLLQPARKLTECLTSVRNAQFLLFRSFGQRAIEGRVIENRVVPKSSLASWGVGNPAPDDPRSLVHKCPAVHYRDGTDEPAAPRAGMWGQAPVNL